MPDENKQEVMLGARVDPDLHRKVKVKAAMEGRTLADVLRELLRKWVGENGNHEDKKS